MIGHMRSPVRTTLALLACTCLAACSSSDGSAKPEPTPAPTSVAAFPTAPDVTGPVAVSLQPGLTVMTDDRCRPEEKRRVCSADGTQAWAPLGDPGDATLLEAGTHLADQHTSWTAVLRFSPESRPSLRGAAREAAASGGVVLVVRKGRVLAAVPATGVSGATAAVTDLDKPTAWDLVAGFGGS